MNEEATKPVSRRTVAKGAAWAAPVILGANAAPAYAASQPPVYPELTPGQTCKHTGKEPHVYHVAVTWKNTLVCDSLVHIVELVVEPNSGGEAEFPTISDFGVAAGDTANVYFDSCTTGNLANGTATVTYEYEGCDGETYPGSAQLEFATLPPCDSDIHSWPEPLPSCQA